MRPVSKYSIVQFVPDPIADERLNIGVIVIRGDRVKVRFLEKWGRVRKLANPDEVTVLQDFAESIRELVSQNAIQNQLELFNSDPSSIPRLLRMIGEHQHIVQFTPLRPSLDDLEILLDDLSARFLKQQPRIRATIRSKDQVVKSAVTSLRNAISDGVQGYSADQLVHTKHRTRGNVLRTVTFDVVVMNGSLYAASQALSFQVLEPSQVRWHEALFTLLDLKARLPDIQTSIVYAPPGGRGSNAQRARALLDDARFSAKEAGMEMISESETVIWAQTLSEKLEPALTGHD